MKSVVAFFLTCLSAVVLSGCGGGFSIPSFTVPNLGTQTTNTPDRAPLSATVQGPRSNHTTYTGGAINIDALFNFYSDHYHADGRRITDSSRFFFFENNDEMGSNDVNPPGYFVLRNPTSNGSVAPAIILFDITTGRTYAAADGTLTIGTQFSTGQSFVLRQGNSNPITVRINSNGLILGSATLNVSSGYTLRMYNRFRNLPSSAASSSEINIQHFFLNAEYSALYMGTRYPITAITADVGGVSNGGVLTDYADIPTTGNVTYNIHHAIGAYRDGQNLANNRLLYGSGSLSANFGSRTVELDLSITDNNGNRFMDVVDLRMTIDQDRNQFHCGSAGSSSCSGNFNYMSSNIRLPSTSLGSGGSSSNRFNAQGSFYGPNAEEVAGGIQHSNTNGAKMDIGFIGKQ